MLFNEINMPVPREWQQEALPTIQKLLINPQNRVMLCVPTGGGKTNIAAMVISEFIKSGLRCMFIVDKLVLINQTIGTFRKFGIECDILQGGNSTYRNCQVIVASQPTLIRRDFPDNIGLLVIDEAQTLSKLLKDIILHCGIPSLGLSATPFTKGLGKIFNQLLNPITADTLTNEGILVPLRVLRCKKINMQGAKVVAGEYTDHDVEERALDIVGDVVQEYKNHSNEKAIAFCCTIKQCIALMNEFNAKGIPAQIFCASTTAEERLEIIHKYTYTNEIMVLVSVYCLSIGFDAPNVKCILDCRPLRKSLSVYVQSIGRGIRSMEGKNYCLLLDFTGNIQTFIKDFEDFYMNGIQSLDAAEKKDRPRSDKELEETQKVKAGCPKCGGTIWLARKCLSCGYVIEIEKEDFLTDKDDYEMVEVPLFQGKKGVTNSELWSQISNYVYTSTDHRSYNQAAATRRCLAIYKTLTSEFPKYGQIIAPTKDGYVSREVAGKIIKMNIAYHKAKQQQQTMQTALIEGSYSR